MVDQELVREVEKAYFTYFRRHNEVAPMGDPVSGLRWQALEDVLETGEPDFYAAVEVDDAVGIVVVINGVLHLIRPTTTEVVTWTVGSLGGGTYKERLFVGENGQTLEGAFSHPRLPGDLTIRTRRWEDFARLKEIRDLFRHWVSMKEPATLGG
jgi:hypothetical protein